MEAEQYIKTLCQECDQPIEFPADRFGDEANCPHCQKLIKLGIPSDSKPVLLPPVPTPNAKKSKFETWDIIRNKKLMPIAFTIGISILSVCRIDKNSIDYEYHPIACVIGSVSPAFVIGGIWYYRIARKKSVK